MARSWKDLRGSMSPESQARVRDRVERELLAMNLRDLRTSVDGLTQVEIAKLLDSTQGAISQLERREDMLLSNLRAYVQALGGELELVVRFQDREPVRISQFDEVREQIKETA